MRCYHMAGDTDIRKARLGAQCEWRRSPPREETFISCQSLGGPVRAPIPDGSGIGAERFCQMMANTRRDQRMGIRDRRKGQGARISPLFRVLRYQPRFGLEIFAVI